MAVEMLACHPGAASNKRNIGPLPRRRNRKHDHVGTDGIAASRSIGTGHASVPAVHRSGGGCSITRSLVALFPLRWLILTREACGIARSITWTTAARQMASLSVIRRQALDQAY